MSGPPRIGVLGGSFDPPHAGHVAVAEAAVRQLGLDRLLVIPAAQAPLRDAAARAGADDRLELARLAFAGVPRAAVDDREIRRGGVSYSVDTARELARENPGADLVWVLGADQLSRLHLWREAPGLCRLARFAVLAREGREGSVDASLASVARVERLRAPEVDVSSTRLRALLASGADAGKALPPAVAAAIQARSLYRD